MTTTNTKALCSHGFPFGRCRYDESHNHQTDQDAYRQVLRGRMGSLAGASDDYLLALERRALEWIDEIRAEVAKRIAAANDHADQLDKEGDAIAESADVAAEERYADQ